MLRHETGQSTGEGNGERLSTRAYHQKILCKKFQETCKKTYISQQVK